MATVKVTRVSGFFAVTDVVFNTISDGKLFYIARKGTKFNLAIGAYSYTGDFQSLGKPLVYSFKIPAIETQTKLPRRFVFIFRNNPNKCSVHLQSGFVIFDNMFKQYPKYVLKYIAKHELGHYRYRGNGNDSEIKCDIFASVSMLNLGYNFSQIISAQEICLRENINNNERKVLNKAYLKSIDK